VSIDACTTRLRLIVASQQAVDTDALKQLGARGLVRPSATALQVVIGTNADQVAGEIKAALRSVRSHDVPLSTRALMPLSSPAASAVEPAVAGPDAATLQGLLAALGGRANVRTVDVAASRLRIEVLKASAIDAAAIRSLGLRGVAVPSAECVHVIVGPAAGGASESLRRLLA
jgi:PTS system N-acetylglucosamine-specific IIC component